MRPNANALKATAGYCVVIDSLAEGRVPAIRDGNDAPCVFATRLEAQREIADNAITRLQEFIDGHRDYDDAITVEEYIVEVDVLADGSVVDEDENHFGSRRR